MKRRSSSLSKTALRRIMEQAQLSNAATVNIDFPTGETVRIELNKEQSMNRDIKLDDNFTL